MTPEEKAIDRIRMQAGQHRSAPSPRVWEMLKDRLDLDQSRRKTTLYRNIAVAASLLLCVTVGSNILWDTKHTANTSPMHTYTLADLSNAQQAYAELYNAERARSMYSIYRTIGM